MNIFLKLMPLVLFVALAAFLYRGLALDPAELPSPLIGKVAPEFSVAQLPRTANDPQLADFNSGELDGQVWVLNVWASWCGPCVQEHPYLVSLAQQRAVPLVGLNYKDLPEDAQPWLAKLGDPFTFLLDDREGDVGIDWGVYGVTETFIIDKLGKVRYKHVGPVDAQSLEEKLIPMIDQLQKETS